MSGATLSAVAEQPAPNAAIAEAGVRETFLHTLSSIGDSAQISVMQLPSGTVAIAAYAPDGGPAVIDAYLSPQAAAALRADLMVLDLPRPKA